MHTKTEYMVARKVEGEFVPLHWTAASDENAEQGIKDMAYDFNKDEALFMKVDVSELKTPFVVLKATTTYEEI